MSNTSLMESVKNALDLYQREKLTRKELISSVEINGQALENMPYALVKQIDEIEYKFMMAQFADENDSEVTEDEAIKFLVSWLEKLPK